MPTINFSIDLSDADFERHIMPLFRGGNAVGKSEPPKQIEAPKAEAPKAEAAKPAPAAKAEAPKAEAAKPAPAAKAEAPKGPTREEVRDALRAVAGAADKGLSKDDAMAVLKEVGGVASINELAKEKFQAVFDAAQRVLAEGKTAPAAEADPFA